MDTAATSPVPRRLPIAQIAIALLLVALLGGIAWVSWQRAHRKAHVRRAVALLQHIAERQRQHRQDFHRYASTAEDDADWWPRDMAPGKGNVWGIDCRKPGDVAAHPGWCALDLEIPPDERVWFAFLVRAKDPAQPWKPPKALIDDPQEDGWYAKARADFDGDGVYSEIAVSSDLEEPLREDPME